MMRKYFRVLSDSIVLAWDLACLTLSALFLYAKLKYVSWRRKNAFRRTLKEQGMGEGEARELAGELKFINLGDFLHYLN